MMCDSSLNGIDQHSLCTKYFNMRVENHSWSDNGRYMQPLTFRNSDET